MKLPLLLLPLALPLASISCSSTRGTSNVGIGNGTIAASIPIDDVPDGRVTPAAPPPVRPYERPVTESKDVNPAGR